VRLGKLLEGLRDRVIHRSQLGKRRLDAAFTRRELDQKWVELGERYSELARQGRVSVPEDLGSLIDEIRCLEQRLAEQKQDVANLEREVARET
jgi:hypothetical protein